MRVVIFQLISRMKKFCLTKIFQKILNWQILHLLFFKKDKISAENYTPVIFLPIVSKIFERIMQKQITDYIGKFLFGFVCGYKIGFSTQHTLLSLIEKRRHNIDKQGFAEALLMVPSKAFATIDHELLIAKLQAYGFSIKVLEILLSYLQERR